MISRFKIVFRTLRPYVSTFGIGAFLKSSTYVRRFHAGLIFHHKRKHMKTFILAVIYAAIVTQSEGCDIIKDLTGREWHELPVGTKAFMIFAAIWGAGILILIADYLLSGREDQQP